MRIVSLFSGCGGLDWGFQRAGFDVFWANEYDQTIWDTYQLNHKQTYLETVDIRTLTAESIPDCDGIIGGPPCQAWSEGGKSLGLQDERGRLFFDYIRIVNAKHPKFFLIENVEGLLAEQHTKAFDTFMTMLCNVGYTLYRELLNTADFKIPQDRKRVIIVGIRNDYAAKPFLFPTPFDTPKITLYTAIGDINEAPTKCIECVDHQNGKKWENHEYYDGPYDAKYMSRNRVRSWHEVSFTIQALAKNIPIHPQAPKMTFISYDKRIFAKGKELLYRRLSIRECARIQTFPDSFKFLYTNIEVGYKMIGNAVPPRLAFFMAESIKQYFST